MVLSSVTRYGSRRPLEHSIAIVTELLDLADRVATIRGLQGHLPGRMSRQDFAAVLTEALARRAAARAHPGAVRQSPAARELPAGRRGGSVATRIVRRLGIPRHTLHLAVHGRGQPMAEPGWDMPFNAAGGSAD